MQYPLISEYVDAIRSAIARIHKAFANVLSRLLVVVKLQNQEVIEAEEELSMEVTDEDWKNAIKDNFGVRYSRDGKRLLKGANVESYKIKEKTKVICDGAFKWWYHSLREISIPESVTSIGNEAFSKCTSLQQISIPLSVTSIGNDPFCGCESLWIIKIPKCSRKHFEQLLPDYKDKLVEVDNI